MKVLFAFLVVRMLKGLSNKTEELQNLLYAWNII